MMEYKKDRIIFKVFVFVVMIMFINMAYHLGLVTGKNRAEKNLSCVSQESIKQWKDTLEVTKAICLEIQPLQIDKLEKNYNKLIIASEEKTDYWKKSYYWCENRSNKKE